jgi:hypothetical protein
MKTEATSFIIRIWIDSAAENGEPPVWRGVIQQVGSLDKQHFHELSSVTQFIRERADIQQQPSLREWWGALWWNLRNEIRKRLPAKR